MKPPQQLFSRMIAIAGMVMSLTASPVAAPSANAANTAEQIPARTKIVGSSTVSKFATIAQQKLAQRQVNVVIETTGTRGGFSLFCSSQDAYFAPIALASRKITPEELSTCQAQDLSDIQEYNLGQSGVIIAQKKSRRPFHLTRKDLFLALAAQTPISDTDCRLEPNPRRRWREVAPQYSNTMIRVFGPPLTSGTRASFIELAVKKGALEIDCMKKLRAKDPAAFKKATASLRSDGAWIDAGENDSVILAAIERIPQALGVIGYPLYSARQDKLSAATIEGVRPDPQTISSGEYGLSRILRVYAKNGALEQNAAAKAFIDELTSQEAIGAEGYLKKHGLIPFNRTKTD